MLVIDYRAACELPKEAAHIEISFYGFTYFYVADIINALTAAGLAGYGLYAALRVKKRENA